ncbi:MAG: hypothetical protein U1D31_03430 [Patescibacteria group bacterium]|nr:hypothetical protein [Patescibacteria group bacterium]
MNRPQTKTEALRSYVQANPRKTARKVAEVFGVSVASVRQMRWRLGIKYDKKGLAQYMRENHTDIGRGADRITGNRKKYG